MKDSLVERQSLRVRTHHWMLHQVIELDHGLECCFRLTLVNAELKLVDVTRAVLLQTRSSAPSGSLQDADILTEVPRLDRAPTGGDTVRYLLEMKSEVRVKEMALQLLRYQFGAYLLDWTPVRAVLISNDEGYRGSRRDLFPGIDRGTRRCVLVAVWWSGAAVWGDGVEFVFEANSK